MKLKRGDAVAVVAPASPQIRGEEGLVEKAIEVIHSWGLRVVDRPNLELRHFYLAGSDDVRAEALNRVLSNPEIRGIFVTRGGYGCARLIPYLKPQEWSPQKKIFVGLSDVTTLLLYLKHVTKIQLFHGPALATQQFLTLPEATQTQDSLYQHLFKTPEPVGLSFLKPGIFPRASVVGGCLTLVTSSLGTSYEIKTRGHILFLEEVKEAPYRIDRMLMQLKLSGKFQGIHGIIFGTMEGCLGDKGELWDVLIDFFKDADFPVAYQYPSGHGPMCVTLPLGIPLQFKN